MSSYRWNARKITKITTTYTILTDDDHISATIGGSVTITLPSIKALAKAGKFPKAYYIISESASSTHDLTIAPGTDEETGAPDTINGTTSLVLGDGGDWVIIQCEASGNWIVVDTNDVPA